MAERLRVEVRGAVQGVGFRPYVYRLASELGLNGWVLNDSRGVFVELDGPRTTLDEFLRRLPRERPPLAEIESVAPSWHAAGGFSDLVIRKSDEGGDKVVVVLPEAATCADCLREILDPGDRRYRYPFTNCTNCGPRFSIVRSLPYDRPNTTMRGFVMCARCQGEYEDPSDRRFHAQPNACPDCGPQLTLADPDGRTLGERDEALRRVVEALREGRIAAVKGLGGFHLMADASDEAAVGALRERKGRYGKPLALMVRDLDQARALCELPAGAEALLASTAAPIVLLRRRPESPVADAVAPGNPDLGIMLPYTPLHHLLLRDVGMPLVATSGNLSDEPICTDNREALDRLGAIADLFLLHDRPIVRHVDDSVVRRQREGFQPLRRARGRAPLPVRLDRELPPVLAVGAHLKNVIALSVGRNVFLSQHIGDMETPQAMAAFESVVRDFLDLYEARPAIVAHDLHPDYPSTQWLARVRAGAQGGACQESLRAAEVRPVQHHHAHLAACLADNSVDGAALGVTWDGTGYGTDGTVWGGEFLLGDARSYERVARLRPFRLPGGEAAIAQPRRVALALLWEMYGREALDLVEPTALGALDDTESRVLARMLERGFHSPTTSSCGRLFDGVAALIGLKPTVSFEGEAAMALEFLAARSAAGAYPIELTASAASGPDAPRFELDWAPLVEAVLGDLRRGVEPDIIAARFHNALARAVCAVAKQVDESTVALTGGCFQNALLTERTADLLEEAGFTVLLHRRVPANDGGICLGQVAVAAAGAAACA